MSFDPEFAVVQGWPRGKIDLLMMGVVTLVTVAGLRSVGMILVVALLIVPAAAARFWTEKLGLMIGLSGFFGGASGYLGSCASALFPRLPAGSVIVITAGCIFLVSFLFAPNRGVVFGLYRLIDLRISVLFDHFLREIYENYESRGDDFSSYLDVSNLRLYRNMSFFSSKFISSLCRFLNYIDFTGSTLRLTEKGLARAQQLVRNHRLWELYLFEYSGLSPSHIDYSADLVEHILSEELVGKLEAELKEQGKLPETGIESIHPLSRDNVESGEGEDV